MAASRAAILTGTYNHVNGVLTLSTPFDARQPGFPGLLQAAGYQTALVGKWHLGHGGVHDPRGFDHWCVFPDEGAYHDPEMLERGRLCLLVHHKAPHRPWLPDDRHAGLYQADRIPEPPTFGDDYRYRSAAAAQARMRVADDLGVEDVKSGGPARAGRGPAGGLGLPALRQGLPAVCGQPRRQRRPAAQQLALELARVQAEVGDRPWRAG